MRLLKSEGFDYLYEDSDERLEGRVEVCVGGNYSTVCDDEWDDSDASVACRQLGFSPYGINFGTQWIIVVICLTWVTGSIALSGGVFSSSELSIALSLVNCSGDEDNLLNCPLQKSSNCPSAETAAVICQGLMSIYFSYFFCCYLIVYCRENLKDRY